MTLLVTDAIVLHAINYLESSRILRLLTREAGVQSVLARGARSSRKRFGNAVDLFAEGEVQLQLKPGRDLQTLVSFDVTRARPALGADLGRFMAANALTECVLRVVHDEAAPSVYDGVLQGLDAIAAAPAGETVRVALGALWRLVSDVGFSPVLDRCAECHAPIPGNEDATFSHRAGGTLCGACSGILGGGRRLPAEARAVLGAWMEGGEPVVGDADCRAHQRLLREFLSQHLTDGRELRAFVAWERGHIEAV
jgi:DNA repair protein RecO (recombination protein O)